MEILLGIVVIVLLCIIIYLVTRPPKINEKIVERTIQVDASAEEKAKYEEYYRLKQQELDAQFTEEQRNRFIELENWQKEKLEEIEQSFKLKKVRLLDQIQDEFALHKNELELKKSNLKIAFEEYRKQIKNQVSDLFSEVDEAKNLIQEWREKHQGAISSFQNLDKLKEKENFYKISFNDVEKEELNELSAAVRKLRNPMPFYKAIYDIYYKNKVSDLVLRIVGKNRISGIYKITHIESGKVYIGQSVDIGERWKQHAKRGCGADLVTQNKLYPAMMEFGLDKFQFEIIEITIDLTKLSEMEKYWQEFFKAKEFGYSMK